MPAVPPNLIKRDIRSILLVPRYRAGPVNLGATKTPLTKTPPSWMLFIGTLDSNLLLKSIPQSVAYSQSQPEQVVDAPRN